MTVANRIRKAPAAAGSPAKKANVGKAAPPVPVGEAPDLGAGAGSASTPATIAPAKPDLPSPEHKDADTLPLMRAITTHVKYRLRAYLKESRSATSAFADVELHEHAPLGIKRAAEGDDQELLSYKAAWNPDTAAVSLDGTMRYEAGGEHFLFAPVLFQRGRRGEGGRRNAVMGPGARDGKSVPPERRQ